MLVSARMLEIVKYLYLHKTTTYKQIEQALSIKERNVRYDIDRINEILTSINLNPILKESKGVLKIPDQFNLDIFETTNEFIYSQEERSSILLTYLLFDDHNLKLSRVSNDLQISRSTIKNDLANLEKHLAKKNIVIKYANHFYLDCDVKQRIILMTNELKKHILIIKYQNKLNSYQKYIVNIIKNAFYHVSLDKIITLIDNTLEQIDFPLSDDAYNWYVANILCMIWFFEHEEIPSFEFEILGTVDDTIKIFINHLEELLPKNIDYNQKDKMMRFLNYINQYTGFASNPNSANVETIVTNFVSSMSLEMGIPFQNDSILIEGLFNHIIPLIHRIKLGVAVNEDVISLLSTKNLEVYEIVSRVITKIDQLNQIINENEIAYLAIHFIASIKRINHKKLKRVLLICGHGYGTTTMLKETLLNQYQVEIVDSIPKYKIPSYQNFDNVDIIISTMKLDTDIPYLQINPILTENDDRCLIKAGVARRATISNFYSINKSLDFLTDEDRLRVLDVIRQELGYRNLTKPKTISRLSDLLNPHVIKIIDTPMTWQEAVIQSCGILEDNQATNRNYMASIFNSIDQNGFYSIIDGAFALLHGNCEHGVFKTAMAMIINKEPIKFGDKKTNIIFCLSSKDQKEHIPAIINLMKLEKTTDFIKYVIKANSAIEAYEILTSYEGRLI